jgi:acetylornithine/succinyldiaminopimelate/putrescine aminotransferase
VVDTGTPLELKHEILSYSRHYEVLAALNATVRLRGPSRHVFSFTDLTSAHGAVNFGHMNPAIDPFATRVSDLVSSIYPPSAASYAQWLLKNLALSTHTVLYQAGEGVTVSAAIAMAQRIRPGKVLAVDGSVHSGLSHGLEAGREKLTLDVRNSESVAWLTPGSEFSAWDDVSCLLYEPIQGACGNVPLPLPWLRGLSQSAQSAGVAVIADEIQSGFYRFGKLSLASSEYLRPDFYLFGNSMTNGIYPLFAIVAPKAIEDAFPAEIDGWKPTFQTASLGIQAAESVARFIDSNDIEAQVTQIHSTLSQASERLAANPRLSAFHLAGPTLSLEVRSGRAAQLVQACEERCVLVSAGSRGRRVRVAPPITIPPDQLAHALNLFEQAVNTL